MKKTVHSVNKPHMLSGKLPLVHSWYKTQSHPAEATAGFYNTINRDGYEEIAKIFSRNSCKMVFPGMDLLDEQQPAESFSSPKRLLADIRAACRNHGVEICGQNLNISGTSKSFEQTKKNVEGRNGNGIDLFIYQRLGAKFFSPKNFPLLSGFVRSLKQLEMDSDDLVVNERESVVFVPGNSGKDRKLQTV